MLVDFSVGNYRSIREIQSLSMVAANIVSKAKEIDFNNTALAASGDRLLKSKAIYGANASGKSNLIQALIVFRGVVANSVKDDKFLKEWMKPHLLFSETESAPCFFQIIFVLKGVKYRYGFEADADRILKEWLFGTPSRKEVPFFTREGDDIYVNPKHLKEASKFADLFKQAENEVARANALFLTMLRVLIGGFAKEVSDYFDRILIVSGLTDSGLYSIANAAMKEAPLKARMAELLKMADTGILDIERVELREDNLDAEIPEEIVAKLKHGETTSKIVTLHKQFDENLKPSKDISFNMRHDESEGSQKMFNLSPLLILALGDERTILIDEFDARLHPLLTRKIVQLFNSPTNPRAQFIFTTHDTNLLDSRLMRRDQVCFAEKDKYGGSHYYTLAEFKGVRNDASFEKDYIAGRYGAIPFLGDFETIFEHSNGEK